MSKKSLKIAEFSKILDFDVMKYSSYKGEETLTFSLQELYSGYNGNDMLFSISKLFAKLVELGFENNGLWIQYGYYDSVDDLLLRVSRKIPK